MKRSACVLEKGRINWTWANYFIGATRRRRVRLWCSSGVTRVFIDGWGNILIANNQACLSLCISCIFTLTSQLSLHGVRFLQRVYPEGFKRLLRCDKPDPALQNFYRPLTYFMHTNTACWIFSRGFVLEVRLENRMRCKRQPSNL
jgi:hypothetical protein